MIVSDITELKLMAVLERGSPNLECIAIQAKERINLGQYGIMIANYAYKNGAFPFRDNLFWFGDGIIEKNDWVFVFTGSGEPRQNTAYDKKSNIYTIFWGKPTTIFAQTNIVPILFRIDAAEIMPPPIDMPQIRKLDN